MTHAGTVLKQGALYNWLLAGYSSLTDRTAFHACILTDCSVILVSLPIPRDGKT